MQVRPVVILTGRDAVQTRKAKLYKSPVYFRIIKKNKFSFILQMSFYDLFLILQFTMTIKLNLILLNEIENQSFSFLHKYTKKINKKWSTALPIFLISRLRLVFLHPQSSHPSCHPPRHPAGEHKQFAVISVPLPIWANFPWRHHPHIYLHPVMGASR